MRPSLMRQATLGAVSTDGLLSEPPLSPPANDLHLGATADSVMKDSLDSTLTVDQVRRGMAGNGVLMMAVLFSPTV